MSWLSTRVVSNASVPLSAPVPPKFSNSIPTSGLGDSPACNRFASSSRGPQAAALRPGFWRSAAARALLGVRSPDVATSGDASRSSPGTAGAWYFGRPRRSGRDSSGSNANGEGAHAGIIVITPRMAAPSNLDVGFNRMDSARLGKGAWHMPSAGTESACRGAQSQFIP